jgi:hypothetical protein
MKNIIKNYVVTLLILLTLPSVTLLANPEAKDCSKHRIGSPPSGFLEYGGKVAWEKVLAKITERWVFVAENKERFELSNNFGMLEKPQDVNFEDLKDTLLSKTPYDYVVYAHVDRATKKVMCISIAKVRPY